MFLKTKIKIPTWQCFTRLEERTCGLMPVRRLYGIKRKIPKDKKQWMTRREWKNKLIPISKERLKEFEDKIRNADKEWIGLHVYVYVYSMYMFFGYNKSQYNSGKEKYWQQDIPSVG